jgi:hypothetical protein
MNETVRGRCKPYREFESLSLRHYSPQTFLSGDFAATKREELRPFATKLCTLERGALLKSVLYGAIFSTPVDFSPEIRFRVFQ